jgi:hypothetical protein
MHHQFGVRKHSFSGPGIGQPGRMIGMHVGEQDGIDVLRIDISRREIASDPAVGGPHRSSGAGIGKRRFTLRRNEKRIDAYPPHRPERVDQDATRLTNIDILQQVESSIDVTVADGRHDEIADLTMIETGYLLRVLGS